MAQGGAAREKDLTLALARTVRARILAGGRARVALTRDTDRYLSLRERIEIGRALGARLFVSLHADAAPAGDAAHGATIYTLSETASDAEAAALARSENRADIVRGIDLGAARDDVASILIDLAQRETRADALAFARLLHREAEASVPFRPDHLRTASLMVLKAPDMPSVLLEAGYITNATDLAFIGAPDGQRRIADAIARAIDAHFARKAARR
ncbi:N-acetylmuramoyl-L-alanine amidase family protein [Sphingomonas changnyeongensis]|uniref:N-acetylmuramoyl-L-alanine amidase family protein n=1 Tax=Sphingomonas changnyeongensis TaxID=2698679 RepID=UPI001E54B952|nr:N-acetylmuramoyl-L-alanine amidase [Sphingomonas changnyeongensis]